MCCFAIAGAENQGSAKGACILGKPPHAGADEVDDFAGEMLVARLR